MKNNNSKKSNPQTSPLKKEDNFLDLHKNILFSAEYLLSQIQKKNVIQSPTNQNLQDKNLKNDNEIRPLILSAMALLDTLCVPGIPTNTEREARFLLAKIYQNYCQEFEAEETNLQKILLLNPTGITSAEWKLKIEILLIEFYLRANKTHFAIKRLEDMLLEARE
ncbi:hypothetical protein BB559_004232 [Furculomyces boomerangus]|uniref:Uncharacterized protein n=2 Tax=Harpellales TaxID=61421 RepID=A0A2T9YFW2_9FUNG|nr:hypothetical protein BB559_004232 [Furculomyces boomerangus]PWA01932.1 hypothetical protein BB558_001954 [Smittium angustum]